MSDKQAAIEAIQRLPDAVTLKEISEELELLAAIREGEDQADRGQVIPLEQLQQNLQQWLSKS
jgi:predicted transcriptional regulator